MIKFYANMYLVKGKIKEMETTTFLGLSSDKELEQQEKSIIPILESILAKDKKIKAEKKTVWFIEFEGLKWLESGSFKDFEKSEMTLKKTAYTPAQFVKVGKDMIKADLKALARPDKEEDYS